MYAFQYTQSVEHRSIKREPSDLQAPRESDRDELSGDAYVATSPEFEGVSGIGGTAESALHEARTALRLAIKTYQAEDWPLPPPETLVEHSGQFRLRIPRSLHSRLVQRAADEGVSLNSYAMSLLAEGVGAAD